MKYMFLLLIAISTSGCLPDDYYKCGDLIPIVYDDWGRNRSLDRKVCYDGKWTAVRGGPWYECQCKETVPLPKVEIEVEQPKINPQNMSEQLWCEESK
jgi:hypothetical protein